MSCPFIADGGSPFHPSSDPEMDLSSSSPLRKGVVTKLTSDENEDPCVSVTRHMVSVHGSLTRRLVE